MFAGEDLTYLPGVEGGDVLPRGLVCQGEDPATLAEIYRPDVNIAIWQRCISASLADSVQAGSTLPHGFELSMTVTPDSAQVSLRAELASQCTAALQADVCLLVDMFCCLLDTEQVGLRLRVLEHAMCPRFHVDNVPCRLITTYTGAATQWLAHGAVDRSKLGRGNGGLPDSESGVYFDARDIQQLSCGEVALLKGERWQGNEGAGLVHRSPALASGERRLLLTLDIV